MSDLEPASRLSEGEVAALAGRLHGELLRPGDAGFDPARHIWNGMIDRHPALIARCADEEDVVTAVRFARQHAVLTAVRGGGHSMPGLSMVDDGLVIDLSPLRRIAVEPGERRARVAAGCTLGEFDRAAQEHGLATPAGAIAHTGVAGLTLGGGIGWLQRPYGLTIDSLLSARVVTADGERLLADATHEPDLYWGLRGGGGNFGIVTDFEFRLHPVGPMVLAGGVVHPIDDVGAVFGFWRDWIETVPDGLTSIAAVYTCPPDPEVPRELHGKHVCGVIVNWVGSQEEGERVVAPLRAFGPPAADLIRMQPFVELQSSQDEKFAWGRRYYNKNAYLDHLGDRVIERCAEHIARVTSPLSAVAILHLGAAVSRVRPDETAYVNRDALFNLDITSIWTDPGEDDGHVGWVRDFHASIRDEAMVGEYVNTTSMDAGRDVRAAYGANWERLVALKDRFDPTNFFRFNQNIPPSASRGS